MPQLHLVPSKQPHKFRLGNGGSGLRLIGFAGHFCYSSPRRQFCRNFVLNITNSFSGCLWPFSSSPLDRIELAYLFQNLMNTENFKNRMWVAVEFVFPFWALGFIGIPFVHPSHSHCANCPGKGLIGLSVTWQKLRQNLRLHEL